MWEISGAETPEHVRILRFDANSRANDYVPGGRTVPAGQREIYSGRFDLRFR